MYPIFPATAATETLRRRQHSVFWRPAAAPAAHEPTSASAAGAAGAVVSRGSRGGDGRRGHDLVRVEHVTSEERAVDAQGVRLVRRTAKVSLGKS